MAKKSARKINIPFFERIRERSKQVPLAIRLYVHLEYNWYTHHIKKSRFHTEEEEIKARIWAARMTKYIIKIIKKWEKDGSPRKTYKL